MKPYSHYCGFAVLMVCVAALSACTGVKCRVSAHDVSQPVSLTPYVFATNGTLLKTTEQDVIKHITIKKTFWGMLWRSVELTDNDWDVSDDFQHVLNAEKGDAIVNLTLLVRGDWWYWISSLVPIVPSAATVVIDADVVRIGSLDQRIATANADATLLNEKKILSEYLRPRLRQLRNGMTTREVYEILDWKSAPPMSEVGRANLDAIRDDFLAAMSGQTGSIVLYHVNEMSALHRAGDKSSDPKEDLSQMRIAFSCDFANGTIVKVASY